MAAWGSWWSRSGTQPISDLGHALAGCRLDRSTVTLRAKDHPLEWQSL